MIPAAMGGQRREVGTELLVWAALAAGFSPVLAHLGATAWSVPQTRPVLVVPLLLAWQLKRGPGMRGRPRPHGLVAIAIGLLLEIVGIVGQTWSLARLGLPIALCGAGRFLGRPPLPLLALSFFAIPPPISVSAFASPHLELLLADVAQAPLGLLGLELERLGRDWVSPSGDRLPLRPGDGGVRLAHMLAAIGWFSAVRGGAGLIALARRTALGFASGLPAQILGLAAAGLLLAAWGAEVARSWLTHGLWPLAALFAVLAFSRSARPRGRGLGAAQGAARGGGTARSSTSR